ncbi:MAG: 23S rRNA (pseudouridine(1915)-N(3))-methyltransferase RlmH [Salibacteraceae bacterium]
MKIRVVSVGKTNMNFVKEAIELYIKRISRYSNISWEELPDVKNSSKISSVELKKREGEQFISKINSADYVVLLDENGVNVSSVEFADFIQHHHNYIPKDLCFVIGGAYGFSDELYARSDKKISLSKMTFSHQLVRSIFCEQLYRAYTIINGEPYHHA